MSNKKKLQRMKIYFIPFSNWVIAKFPKGKRFGIAFNRFPTIGIWCITIGRLMLFNDYRKLADQTEEILRLAELNKGR